MCGKPYAPYFGITAGAGLAYVAKNFFDRLHQRVSIAVHKWEDFRHRVFRKVPSHCFQAMVLGLIAPPSRCRQLYHSLAEIEEARGVIKDRERQMQERGREVRPSFLSLPHTLTGLLDPILHLWVERVCRS